LKTDEIDGKNNEKSNFKNVAIAIALIWIIGLSAVLFLINFEKSSTTSEKLWSVAECKNSVMYEYEDLIIEFYSKGKIQYGDYNTTGDPVRIAEYEVQIRNDTWNDYIGHRELNPTNWKFPYEKVKLEIDLNYIEGISPGEYDIIIFLYPHNETKYPDDFHEFKVSLRQQTKGNELLITLYIFVGPPIYLIIVFFVNRFVNKRFFVNIPYFNKWLTLNTWFYVLKMLYTWFFFWKVTNTSKKHRRRLAKMKKQAEKERLKKEFGRLYWLKFWKKKKNTLYQKEPAEKTISQCPNCKCFLKKDALICPRCGELIS